MIIPRSEYPRPELVRSEWQNLNGIWEFEVDAGNSGEERGLVKQENYAQKIRVPFAPESKLSGLEQVDFMRAVWYRRTFRVPETWRSGRVLLHFGAVDYQAAVWVNGRKAGAHRGGYTPFTLDVTGLLVTGANDLCVRACSDVRSPMQPTGKQCDRYANYGCLYTRCTGIWQTVWLEHVPELYMESVRLTPDVANSRLLIEARLNGPADGLTLRAGAKLAGEPAGECEAAAAGNTVTAVLPLKILRLWNPGAPVLYDLSLSIGDDRADGYFGMRTVKIAKGGLCVNGRKVFQRLVLDQGYYPDGIYTAPDDADLRRDVELSIAAGFNGARLHMKVFEPRLLYWADRLGYLVWGEYPSWGLDVSDERSLTAMLPEWLEELQRDVNHPALIGWCPFNETQENRSAEVFRTVYKVTKAFDSTRPVIDSSGWTHAVTDLYDVHDYDQNPESFRRRYQPLATGEGRVFINNPRAEAEVYQGQPYFVSEFGGIYWDEEVNGKGWGYGEAPKNLEEYYARFEGLVAALLENPSVCAFCYTQLTDVMQEKNGVYTYGRKVKFDLRRLRAALGAPSAWEQKA